MLRKCAAQQPRCQHTVYTSLHTHTQRKRQYSALAHLRLRMTGSLEAVPQQNHQALICDVCKTEVYPITLTATPSTICCISATFIGNSHGWPTCALQRPPCCANTGNRQSQRLHPSRSHPAPYSRQAPTRRSPGGTPHWRLLRMAHHRGCCSSAGTVNHLMVLANK